MNHLIVYNGLVELNNEVINTKFNVDNAVKGIDHDFFKREAIKGLDRMESHIKLIREELEHEIKQNECVSVHHE